MCEKTARNGIGSFDVVSLGQSYGGQFCRRKVVHQGSEHVMGRRSVKVDKRDNDGILLRAVLLVFLASLSVSTERGSEHTIYP